MIEIFNEGKGNIETFESYEDLLKHIKAIEKKRFEETGKEEWNLTIYSNERLARLYHYAIESFRIFMTEKEQEAYENELNLLEMYKGDEDNPTQIILTPDIDIDKIKESWCRDYCLSHGYNFLDTRQ
jgi:hypothetical protein